MVKKPTHNQLAQQVKRLEKQVAQLKGLEKQLRDKHATLKAQTKELREVNRALRALLTQSDKARRDLEERVLSNVKELVVPYIKKFKKNSLDMQQKTYLKILESNLDDIVSPFVHQLSSKYSALTPKEIQVALTPKEIQVAQLIREGKNTIEIAELLSSSKRTIESHRQSIRNKFGIKDMKANLRSYLLSM
jgi:ATP/maltotriose-dependent transcriptional regulator MalT